MNSVIQQLTSYPVNEYKIILVPHEDLSQRITEIRKIFNQKFEPESPIAALPELVLATFKQFNSTEDRIVNRLRLIGMGAHPIKVEIKDFGSFPSHTIYLDVTSKATVAALVKKIREDAQRLMKMDNENKPHFMLDPYFTIGRRLKPWQFEKAMLEYSNKHFSGRFIASSMLLVKRKQGEFKYRPIASFDFQNLPIETKQGMLF